MEKHSTLLLCALLGLSTRAQLTFQKTIGGIVDDQAYSVQRTFDGGYIIGGTTTSFGAGSNDMYLLKLDSIGALQWSSTYGPFNGTEGGYNVVQTADSGYAIIGYTTAVAINPQDAYLVKTDASGSVEWSKHYGGSGYNSGNCIRQTTDHGYIMAGYRNVSDNDVYLIRTNATGDTLWTRAIGGNAADVASAVRSTYDGGFVVTGSTSSFGNSDVFLIKTDADGNTLWSRTYGGPNLDDAYDVEQTADSGFIIAGHTASFGAGVFDVYLMKTDAAGNLAWSRTYGGTQIDEGRSVRQTTDGGYVVAGVTSSFGSGGDDVYLIRTDALGDTLWTRTYGGSSEDLGYAVAQAPDGGFVITGATLSYGMGSTDVYLIKTDADGNTDCDQNYAATVVSDANTEIGSAPFTVASFGTAAPINTLPSTGGTAIALCTSLGLEDPKNNSITIAPNPFASQALVTLNENVTDARITITDAMGRTVREQRFSGDHFTIDKGSLRSGIYFVKLTDAAHKAVVMRILVQ